MSISTVHHSGLSFTTSVGRWLTRSVRWPYVFRGRDVDRLSFRSRQGPRPGRCHRCRPRKPTCQKRATSVPGENAFKSRTGQRLTITNANRRLAPAILVFLVFINARTGHGICWRRGSESNRPRRLCRPLHNRFATSPEDLMHS